MSLLKKLAGLAVGAAALGAAAYVLKNREHGEEYEHIVGPEDEVEPETEPPSPPMRMRLLWLILPPLPHLRNLPPPPKRHSPRNPRKLKKPPPRRLPTLTPRM